MLHAMTAFSMGLQDTGKYQQRFIDQIMDTLLKSFDGTENIKTRKMIATNMISVVKYSGSFSNGKLSGFLVSVSKMLREEKDSELQDYGRRLNLELIENIKSYSDNIDLDQLNLRDCIKLQIKQIKNDSKHLGNWVIGWFNLFITIEKIEFLKDLNLFLRDQIILLGDSNNEVYLALENCLKDLKTKFLASEYKHGRHFCMELLMSLTAMFDDHPNKVKQLEAFQWIYHILNSQLTTNIHNFAMETHNNEEMFEISEERDVSVKPNQGFLDKIAKVLYLVLKCQSEDDSEIKALALNINSLIQERIFAALKKSQELTIYQKVMFRDIFDTLKKIIEREKHHKTIIYTQKWVDLFQDYFPEQLADLSSHVIKNQTSNDAKIVETSVVSIAKCVEKRKQLTLLDELIEFIEKIKLDEQGNAKIFVIIKSLCSVIRGEDVIRYLAKKIDYKGKSEIRKKVVSIFFHIQKKDSKFGFGFEC